MRQLRILHTADLHLDSPFEGLSSGKAALRRSEQRRLLARIAALVSARDIDLVLLSGDLLDSDNTYFETGEELLRALESIAVPVFISPGNHDYYSPRSPYARLTLPKRIHVFKSSAIECVELPELGARVFGAGFTDKVSPAMLNGFSAERGDSVNIMCIHGDVGARDSAYDPISEEQLRKSGMDYVALGHIHKASGLRRAGEVWYSWPGCPEGRGFDETGRKSVSIVTLGGGKCTLETANVARRRYEILPVDITGADALLAVHSALPDDTASDIYRIVLTGETEAAPNVSALQAALSELFFQLQIKDETHIRRSVWERAGDDTLRGLFLEKLKASYDSAPDESARALAEQAARWGLAALDNMEEVTRHETQ